MGKNFFKTMDTSGKGKLYYKQWSGWFTKTGLVSTELLNFMRKTWTEMKDEGFVHEATNTVSEAQFLAWFLAPHKTQAPLTNGDVFFDNKEVAQAFFKDYGNNGLLDALFGDNEFINFIKFFKYLRELKALNQALGLTQGMVTDAELNQWRDWWQEIDAPPKGPRGKIDREQAKDVFVRVQEALDAKAASEK